MEGEERGSASDHEPAAAAADMTEARVAADADVDVDADADVAESAQSPVYTAKTDAAPHNRWAKVSEMAPATKPKTHGTQLVLVPATQLAKMREHNHKHGHKHGHHRRSGSSSDEDEEEEEEEDESNSDDDDVVSDDDEDDESESSESSSSDSDYRRPPHRHKHGHGHGHGQRRRRSSSSSSSSSSRSHRKRGGKKRAPAPPASEQRAGTAANIAEKLNGKIPAELLQVIQQALAPVTLDVDMPFDRTHARSKDRSHPRSRSRSRSRSKSKGHSHIKARRGRHRRSRSRGSTTDDDLDVDPANIVDGPRQSGGPVATFAQQQEQPVLDDDHWKYTYAVIPSTAAAITKAIRCKVNQAGEDTVEHWMRVYGLSKDTAEVVVREVMKAHTFKPNTRRYWRAKFRVSPQQSIAIVRAIQRKNPLAAEMLESFWVHDQQLAPAVAKHVVEHLGVVHHGKPLSTVARSVKRRPAAVPITIDEAPDNGGDTGSERSAADEPAPAAHNGHATAGTVAPPPTPVPAAPHKPATTLTAFWASLKKTTSATTSARPS